MIAARFVQHFSMMLQDIFPSSHTTRKLRRKLLEGIVKTGRRPVPVRGKPKRILAKPAPRVTKPVQKVYTSEFKPAKGDLSNEMRREPSTLAPPAGGYYELSPLMTRMLEAELQDIMIKVWQELPDHPTGDAEELVVDKFRNKAGDDLRNALGINITKRLLNVHNPLYVKIQFTGKPEKVHLSAFLKKYNFNAFKRIESTVNTFAAQVRTIADFDRICATKDIRCGNIKVTVNPCYRFTKCPSNLRTCFKDNEEDCDIKEKDMDMKDIYGIDDKQDINQQSDTKLNFDEIKTDEKVEIITKEKPKVIEVTEQKVDVKPIEKENKPIKTVVPDPKAENHTKIDAKVPEKSAPNGNKVSMVKVNNKVVDTQLNVKNTELNKVEAKTVPTLNQTIKTAVQDAKGNDVIVNKQLNAKNADLNKIEAKKDAAESPKAIAPVKVAKVINKVVNHQLNAKNTDLNKVEAKKVATQNPKVVTPVKVVKENDIIVNKQPIAKNTDSNKVVAKKATTANPKMVTPVKVAKVNNKVVNNQLNAKNTDLNKLAAKKVAAKNQNMKTPLKVCKGNTTVSKPSLQAKKVEKKVEKVENDFDELDDHDILALMSEGIVLDECSGSDDE